MDGERIALDEVLRHLRPARARIDLDRLADNYAALRRLVPVPAMPVVKADAYGHGALPVARRLLAAGAPMLAVAYVEDGRVVAEGAPETVAKVAESHTGRFLADMLGITPPPAQA